MDTGLSTLPIAVLIPTLLDFLFVPGIVRMLGLACIGFAEFGIRLLLQCLLPIACYGRLVGCLVDRFLGCLVYRFLDCYG